MTEQIPTTEDTPERLSGAVITEGITSQVVEDGDVSGHVLLLDYDDGISYADLVQDVGGLEGFTAVFESSPGSFHVWNLSIRSLEDTALLKLRLRDDDLHAGTGYRAGRYVIRLGPKRVVMEDGSEEQYKEAPVLRDCWYNPTAQPQSAAHLGLLANDHDRAADEISIMRGAERSPPEERGEGLMISQYMTATDDIKESWRGDGGTPDPLPACYGGEGQW